MASKKPDTAVAVVEAEEVSTEVAIPGLGTIVDLNDAGSCAQALRDVRDLETVLKQVKATLTAAITEAAKANGKNTFGVAVGDWRAKVTVNHPKEIEWDLEKLAILLDAGLSEQRYGELVVETVTYTVRAQVAKEIAAANPEYAAIIAAARHDVEKAATVTVSL